jgi:hypothetical protein
MEKSNDFQARVRLYFDYDRDTYIFVSSWNNGQHSIRKTVSEDQANIVKDMIMGSYIQVSPK